MSWHSFFSVDKGFVIGRSPVTAIARNQDHLDLFVTGTDGGIHSAYWDNSSSWGSFFRIDDGFAKSRTSVTAIARNPDHLDHLDLFVTGTDDGVHSAYWDNASGWGSFFRIDDGFAKGRTSVTAIARNPDHLDLFVTGTDSEIYSTYWDVAGQWASWFPIGPGFAKGRSAVAAVARNPDHMDLFVTGTDGKIYSAYWDSASGWSTWFPINAGFTKGRSPVTAIARNPKHLDLFVVGADGGVYSTYWDDASGWGTFFRIDAGFFGAPSVTAIARNPEHLDLFVIGSDGGVHSAYWDDKSGWGTFFRIDDGFVTTSATSVSVVARNPDHLDMFVTGTDGGTHSAYWDLGAGVLLGVTITFDTHNDNKEDDTIVHVFVKDRLNNSLSPEEHFDYISNWAALQRFGPAGDLNDGSKNPYLAYGIALGQDDEFEESSSRTFSLTLARPNIGVNEIVLPVVNIHIQTDRGIVLGLDSWIFDYTVTLQFDTGSFSFTSAVDGVRGIILDQDNPNYSGIGIENPLRTLPLPALTKPATNAVLTKVTLEFDTHDDDRKSDTILNVHIVNRLSADSVQDIFIGMDLFKDQEFAAGGPTFSHTWEAENNELASKNIRLADMVLPVVYIVIVPSDEDRWIFDYRVTFEFVDFGDFGHKRRVYSSKTSGVILDQDSNKHAGVYQGPPFPTVAPPTAPILTNQPVDRTGDSRKEISIALLRKKFDAFINSRNGVLDSSNPPLMKIRMSSVSFAGLPPESYLDIQSLINADDGKPRYISNPSTLGQLLRGYVFLEDIEIASLRVSVDPWQGAPLAVTVTFKPGGVVELKDYGAVTIHYLSITLNLTLDKGTIQDKFGHSYTVVDLMSWRTDLQNMVVTLDHVVDLIKFYRVTGSFLHQPVDLVTIEPDVFKLFLGQVIRVDLITDQRTEEILELIESLIYSDLVQAVSLSQISSQSNRDILNSKVTSLLLGGVADDELNPDDNNNFINEIGIRNANPELGIAEDTLVIDYKGPSNVFAPSPPADWPTLENPGSTYDFSPSTLANIDHIVVLTMENRSFDHMLGYLSLPVEKGGRGRHEIDGLKGGESNPYQGTDYPSFKLDQTRFAPGPPNGYESVHHAINGGKMDGFVKSHADLNSDAVAGQAMGYHTGETVPVYDALACDFAIGHRWFASHPGPTYPNRFYELTGRPNLDVDGFWEFDNSSPLRPVFTPTIFDHLNDAIDPVSGAPVTWRFFEDGVCSLRRFERYTFDNENIVDFSHPVDGFLARAKTGQLPSVSFIDPHFVDLPPGSNCNEPPSDIADGQALIQRIVDGVISGPAWPKTLLLIVYDEHGGFYDHVPPPAAARVSAEFPISTLGVRVPVFVISPWVAPGSVFGYDSDRTNPAPPSPGSGTASLARRSAGIGSGLHFDHTSILKTIARRFLSKNPPYMGARYAAASDLSVVIGSQPQQPQFLPFITYRLQFVQTQMLFHAIELDDLGAVLWQAPDDGSVVVPDFSFEDAGDGFVYIRSHVGNRYVTAEAFDSVVTKVTNESPGAKWRLSPVGISVLDRNLFAISNQVYPNKVLQPSNRTSESPVVLGDAAGSAGVHGGNPNVWRVTSPLLSNDLVNTQ